MNKRTEVECLYQTMMFSSIQADIIKAESRVLEIIGGMVFVTKTGACLVPTFSDGRWQIVFAELYNET